MKAVHDQIRDIMCKQCDFATYTKGELNKHVRELHLDIKDHKCDYCSESFHRIKKMIVSLVSKHDNETNNVKFVVEFPESIDPQAATQLEALLPPKMDPTIPEEHDDVGLNDFRPDTTRVQKIIDENSPKQNKE